MLTPEKIKSNFQKFHDTGVKHGFLNDDLLDALGVEFISAPATSNIGWFGAYDGGLVNHILNTAKHAFYLNQQLPEEAQVDTASLIKVCFLHQIGKAKMFIPNPSDWHRNKRGEDYTWNDDKYPMPTATESIRMIGKAGISLSEDEAYAIANYDSDFSNRPMDKKGHKLASILRTANMMAIMEDKLKHPPRELDD